MATARGDGRSDAVAHECVVVGHIHLRKQPRRGRAREGGRAAFGVAGGGAGSRARTPRRGAGPDSPGGRVRTPESVRNLRRSWLRPSEMAAATLSLMNAPQLISVVCGAKARCVAETHKFTGNMRLGYMRVRRFPNQHTPLFTRNDTASGPARMISIASAFVMSHSQRLRMLRPYDSHRKFGCSCSQTGAVPRARRSASHLGVEIVQQHLASGTAEHVRKRCAHGHLSPFWYLWSTCTASMQSPLRSTGSRANNNLPPRARARTTKATATHPSQLGEQPRPH